MSGYVYFIACLPMAAMKIGYTGAHPRARLAAMQTGCPAPLKLYSFFPGSIDDERKLHSAFAPLHIQGEWFRYEGKLRDFACYLTGQASRESFENALHDVLMQGLWYPDNPIPEDAYLLTGDWEPFRDMLWNSHGPWED